MWVQNQEDNGASPDGDRATGLRPQPPTASSLSSVPSAAFAAFSRTSFSLAEIQDWLYGKARNHRRQAAQSDAIGRVLSDHAADVLESAARMARSSLQLQAFGRAADTASAMSARSDETPQEAQSEGRQRDPKGDAR